MNEQITYHVETADNVHVLTDRGEARALNRANPGSSWWVDVVKLAAAVVITAGAALAVTVAPAAHADQTIQEDDPGWDCRTGDHVCGPLSDDAGHQPGCYNDTLKLVADWPCSIVVNADGSSDVYTPDAR